MLFLLGTEMSDICCRLYEAGWEKSALNLSPLTPLLGDERWGWSLVIWSHSFREVCLIKKFVCTDFRCVLHTALFPQALCNNICMNCLKKPKLNTQCPCNHGSSRLGFYLWNWAKLLRITKYSSLSSSDKIMISGVFIFKKMILAKKDRKKWRSLINGRSLERAKFEDWSQSS